MEGGGEEEMVLDALPVLPGVPEEEDREEPGLEGKSVRYLKNSLSQLIVHTLQH